MYRHNHTARPQPRTEDVPPFRLHLEENSGAFENTELAFKEHCVSIGWALGNDVKLANRLGLLSHHHAEIHWLGGCFWLVNCDSKEGTRLNGRRLTPWHLYRLGPGASIRVGEYRIGFALEAAAHYRMAGGWR